MKHVRKTLLLLLLIIQTGCAIDTVCKKPEAGQLIDVKDGIALDNLIFVLSSPQDVLSWCSPYVSVFKIDNGNISFQKNIDLPGKIAGKIVLSKDLILITLPDTNSLYSTSISSMLQNKNDYKQIVLDSVEDIYYISAYEDFFAISSAISKRLIFGNLDDFINSNGKQGFKIFDSFVKTPAIIKNGNEKHVIGLDESGGNVYIFPDKKFTIKDKELKLFNQSISEITQVFSSSEPVSYRPNQVSLFYPITSYKDRIFIPSKLTTEDGETITGIISVLSECFKNETEDLTNCYSFLESPTNSAIEKITYFKAFLFEDTIEIEIPETNKKSDNKSLKKAEIKNADIKLWFFIIKEKNNGKETAYIDIWVENQDYFLSLGRKYIEISPFYHISDVKISDNTSFNLIFYNKNIIIEVQKIK